METTLQALISRRTDLSTFIVHLTRDFEGASARDNLFRILEQWEIEARSPYGLALREFDRFDASDSDWESQNCVCFTETPLEHLYLMVAEITDVKRQCQFRPYGVALTKKIAREKGINPVWYVDITPGKDWLINHVVALVERAFNEGDFADSEIAKITPFIETMGTHGSGFRKEFWWEREWRANYSISLPPRFIVVAPEEEHADFAEFLEEYAGKHPLIDARWGLERIIGHLAGFNRNEVLTV